MMNKKTVSKLFKVGDEIKSGASSTRKNAATVKILAITDEGIQYEPVISKNFVRYTLPYSHLKVLLKCFGDIKPESITKSVNALLSKAGLKLDHVTEAYTYGIVRAICDRNGKIGSLTQQELDFIEGGSTIRRSKQSKRSLAARRECIEHFGAWCQVCNFDFEKNYGVIGKAISMYIITQSNFQCHSKAMR